MRSQANYAATAARLNVCSGYGCPIRESFSLTAAQQAKLARLMAPGRATPAAEREAVRKAVAAMERFARHTLRHRPDVRQSWQRHRNKRGQMDCVDESENTRGYLVHLMNSGLLVHHKPQRGYAERGILVGRFYPHKSAVMRAPDGTDWAVDSWKGDNGSPPEIMRLAEWRKDRASPDAYRP